MSSHQTIVPWVGKTGQLVKYFIDNKLREHGFDLTVSQWLLLKILSANDGQTQNDIALLTKRNKTSLTRLIDTVERKGLVKRVVDPRDRRMKRIILSKNGRKVYAATLPVIEAAFAEIQLGISPEEVSSTIAVLKKIQTNIYNQVFTPLPT